MSTTSDIDNRFPSLSAAAGPGFKLVLSLSQNKSIMIQLKVTDIYVSTLPQSWSALLKSSREAVLDLYSGRWSSDLLEFLRSYDESSIVLRYIYALPVPTITLAHPG
jgi:hypothetical protein